MSEQKIIQGDCLEELKKLSDDSIDSIITDPPYELGFMGKGWDRTGIANSVEMWKQCLRVLKPGGHLLSFGGTRTYHRMAVAIEDAGFEIRDMIEWVYGSGFPKSLNIGKAVDKLQGNEREVVGRNPRINSWKAKDNTGQTYGKYGKSFDEVSTTTKGTSPWEGWGTALKPAHEPICMARKPLSEKSVAENCLKWGTGGINIDESRVGTETMINRSASSIYSQGEKKMDKKEPTIAQGRFPANLIHDNSEEVRECFPETKSGGGNKEPKSETESQFWKIKNDKDYKPDSGNASRFFKSIVYAPKASKAERNKGCEVLEEKQTWASQTKRESNSFDVFESDGRPKTLNKNNHPTVKPIALMEYLITIITPKGGTVLDPFAGSGTTGVASRKNGYNFIGIEKEPDYVLIADARIRATQKTIF